MPHTDQERLAAYDAFAAEVRDELARTGEQMERLRAERKVKTATYRQLFSQRLVLRAIEERLTAHGV